MRTFAPHLTPLITALALILLLSACSSSPPRPPQPDESKRRPANDPQAIELQRCRSDLQNNTIQLHESAEAAQRAAGLAAVNAARMAAVQAMAARMKEDSADRDSAPNASADGARKAQTTRNTIYTVRFALGSADVTLPRAQAEALSQAAADAPLIVLRGRTDGTRDSLTDDRLARQRAEAVRTMLVREGVSAARIRTTWQGAGDHAVDNDSAAGRELNRRVEIEIYRSAPAEMALPVSFAAESGAEKPSRLETAAAKRTSSAAASNALDSTASAP